MLLKDITALRGPSGWEDEARNAIRSEADVLEAMTDKSYWPYPTYSDLLFY